MPSQAAVLTSVSLMMVLDNGMQERGITDRVKANVFLTHAARFSAEVDAQNAHEHFDFSTRTLQILCREGKQRERLDTQTSTC